MLNRLLLSIGFVCASGLLWGQGALPEGLSFYGTPTYSDVFRLAPTNKPGKEEARWGWLTFDSKQAVSFVNRKGHSEFQIPYRSIRALEYERLGPSGVAKSKFGFPLRLNIAGRHLLTVRYDGTQGQETAKMQLDNANYAKILGTFQSKTGLRVARTGQ
jgi:hypothetical protein